MSATRTETEEERKIRAAAAGLNLAVRLEPGLGASPEVFVVEGHGREMQITPELVRLASPEHLHALLAAFAAGATQVVFGEKTVDLVTNPKECGGD